MVRKNKRTTSVFSLLLAVIILVGTVALVVTITAPKAEAASAGKYYVRITWRVKDEGSSLNSFSHADSYSGNDNNMGGIQLFYKLNNGTGDTYKVWWDVGHKHEADAASGENTNQNNISYPAYPDTTLYSYACGSTYSGDTATMDVAHEQKVTNRTEGGFLGIGGTKYYTKHSISRNWYIDDSENEDHCLYATISGFPTRLYVMLDYNAWTSAQYDVTKVEIGSSTSNYKTVWTGAAHVDSSTNLKQVNIYASGQGTDTGNSDSSQKLTTDSKDWPMPAPTTEPAITGSDTIVMNTTGGSTKTSNYSFAIDDLKDQYGVQWPSPKWTENSDYCSITSSATDTPTLTVDATPSTAIAQQTVTITAKSNAKTVATKTVTVQPTFKYKFDATTNGGTAASAVTAGTVINDTSNTYKPWTVTDGFTASKSNTLGDWTFEGWNGSSTATSGTKPGNSINIDNPDDTLYAIYSKTLRYKFNYLDGNGNAVTGTAATPSVTIHNTDTSGEISTPAHSATTKVGGINFNFVGWTFGTGAEDTTTNENKYTIDANKTGYVSTNATETTPNLTQYAVYSKTATANFTYYLADGTRTTTSDTDTIYYNAAGNYNRSKAAIDFPDAQNITVDGKTFEFIGWATAADSFSNDETTANAQKSLTLQNGDYNYYAVYQSDLGLSYEMNDLNHEGVTPGSIARNTVKQKVLANNASILNSSASSVTITVNPGGATPVRVGAEVNDITPDAGFLGWMVLTDTLDPAMEPAAGSAGLFANGDTITINKETTMIAMFKDSRFVLKAVSFDGVSAVNSAGGTPIADQHIRYRFDGAIPAMDTVGADHLDDNAHYVFAGFLVEQGNTLEGDAQSGYTVKNITGTTRLIAQFRAYPHSWVVDHTYSVPTCSEGGQVDRHCAVCGYTENGVAGDPLGHKIQKFDVQAPTCTSDGRKGREVCVVCYKVKCYRCEKNKVADPFVELQTAIVDGVKVKVCPVCGGTYDEVINPKVEAYGDVNEAGLKVHIFDLIEKFTLSEDGKTYSKTETYVEDGETKTRTIVYVLQDADGLFHRVVDGVVTDKTMYTLDGSGNMVYTCRYCDRTVTVYAQSGFMLVGEVRPTCTEDGHIAYYTDGNGNYYRNADGSGPLTEEELVPDAYKRSGHDYEDVAARPVTCTENGYLEGARLCSVCGTPEDASLVLPAAHNITKHAAAKAATCKAVGNKEYYYCARCDKYFTNSSYTVQVANSVALKGEMYCTACDAVKKLAKNEDEEYIFVCPDIAAHEDGAEYELLNTNVVLAKTAHTPADDYVEVYVAPTCTTPGGRYWGQCRDCGADIWPYGQIAALGHDWRLVEGKAATCTETGVEAYYKCFNCGKLAEDAAGEQIITEAVAIPKTAHPTEYVEAVEPTCTAAGNTAYYKCTACGAYFTDAAATEEIENKDSVILGKKEHTYELISEDPGNCQVYSKKVYECSACHDVKTERGGKGDHNYQLCVESEATCGSDGRSYEKCSICGKERNEVITPATGDHTWGEWMDVDGQEIRECSVCHATETRDGEEEPPTEPEDPPTVTGQKCPKCGFVHEGRTGIFVEGGLYCKIVGFFRRILGAFGK